MDPKVVIIFGPAADMVSGAYPMPSRPSVCQLLFKSNRLHQCLSDLSDIWLVCLCTMILTKILWNCLVFYKFAKQKLLMLKNEYGHIF